MMKALIVDDEPLPAKLLDELVKKHCFEITSTEVLNSPTKAIERLKEEHFDVIFLDVEMPKMDAFQFLNSAKLANDTVVIFTTAYSEYAVDAFKANASYYILKPVDKEELITAVRKANVQLRNSFKSNSTIEHLSIFEGDEYQLIKIKDIIRIEGDGSYSKVITKSKDYLSSKRIGFFTSKISNENFFRCHNSHIVNTNRIKKIGKGKSTYIVMENEDTVPVSPSKKPILMKLLQM